MVSGAVTDVMGKVDDGKLLDGNAWAAYTMALTVGEGVVGEAGLQEVDAFSAVAFSSDI